jgi:hypothetical protein
LQRSPWKMLQHKPCKIFAASAHLKDPPTHPPLQMCAAFTVQNVCCIHPANILLLQHNKRYHLSLQP